MYWKILANSILKNWNILYLFVQILIRITSIPKIPYLCAPKIPF